MAAAAQGAGTPQPSLTDRKTVRTMRTRPRYISAGNIAASLTVEPARAVGTLRGVSTCLRRSTALRGQIQRFPRQHFTQWTPRRCAGPLPSGRHPCIRWPIRLDRRADRLMISPSVGLRLHHLLRIGIRHLDFHVHAKRQPRHTASLANDAHFLAVCDIQTDQPSRYYFRSPCKVGTCRVNLLR
jgi:hypothetical protein